MEYEVYHLIFFKIIWKNEPDCWNKQKTLNVLPINHGVPQGSGLGLLLFLIYSNDLNGVVHFSKIYFTDDKNATIYKQFIKRHKQKD